MENVNIRLARREDCIGIKELIKELAEYEKMADEARLTEDDLIRDGFGNSPLFRCFVAEKGKEMIGMALFYITYSSSHGKCIYLEDLCVTSKSRDKGVGSKLFDAVAKVGVDENCVRMDFEVLSWNPATRFYLRKGAIDCTKSKNLHRMRMSLDKSEENLVGDYRSTLDSLSQMESVELRPAKVTDCEEIFRLIKENPDSDNSTDKLTLTVKDLVRDGFSTMPPSFRCLIAEKNEEIVGMGLFFLVYSTWQGKCMQLGDLRVKEAYGNNGIATKLLNAIKEISLNEACARFDFEILASSNEKEFFEQNGMKDVTISENWHQYKLFKDQMINLNK